jgi:two-component system cell cycle sensor histidine kinase/response regulator CckA
LRYTWIHSLQVALPLDDIVGKTDADLVPPEHASKLSALKRRVLDGGNPLREEISVQVLGETRYYDCSVEPLRDAAGQIIGVTGATWDITERKQAEQTQVQLVAMLDATPGFVGFADAKDTHILYINPAGRNMVGVHPQEDVTQLKIADVHPEWTNRLFRDKIIPTAIRDGVWTGECAFLNRDGREIPVMMALLAHKSPSGEVERFSTVSLDITERKQAEKALRLTEFSVNRVADMMSWISPEGRFLFVNDSLCRHLGYSRKELLGMTVWEVDPNVPESWDEQWLEFKKHGSLTFESTHRTKSGEVCPVEVTTNYIEYEGQEYLVAFSRDITDRKQAEELLKDEISRRRMLVEQSTDGIVVLDQCGKVYEANQQFARMLGYCSEEVERLHVWDWESQFSKEQTLEMLSAVDEKGAHFETHHRRKDGTLCEVEISTNGAVYGGRKLIFCVCRDITERKHAEEALRESHERFQLANRATYNAIWDWDLKTDALWWNENFQALFGYASEEIEPGIESWTNRIRPDDLERVTVGIHAAIDSGQQFWSDQYRFRLKDGTYADIEDRGSISRDSNGTPIRMIGAMRNITDRIRAEEEHLQLERQLQHSQKLESLGVLAGGIAHDFNNILTSVLGNAEMALIDLSPSAPARENLLEITASSRRAADLCRQMLAYSGRGQFVIEAIDLGAFIEDLLGLLKSTISKKAVLSLNLEKNLPLLEGDPSQLSQVIVNLVSNASEALGEREGTIAISAGALECSREYLRATYLKPDLTPGLYLTLEVSDTGHGMDAATQERIFEPFFTTKFTGRGLGLAAVLGIVRGHKGALDIHSEPGEGTTFKILLPASEADTSLLARKNGATKNDWQGEGTILLVDDEEAIRTLGRRMLASLGFTVLTAADGREALAVYAAHRHEIKLVLLDLTMPRMDGEEAFRELRLMDPEARVVMSSGYTESDIAPRFANQGLMGFVQKPYTLAQLEEHLRAALSPR